MSKGRKFDATKMDIPSEDAFALCSSGEYELACLADGHGGPGCSNYMAAHLTAQLRREVHEKGALRTQKVLSMLSCKTLPSSYRIG